MADTKEVTLSADANTAVQQIAEKLNLPFEEALGMAIGTQLEILKQTGAGKRVSIARDGKTLQVTAS